MFDWIPISSYTTVYFNVLMIIMLITLFHSYQNDLFDLHTKSFSAIFGHIFLVFIILYIGTRPIHYVFADMGTYAVIYKKIQAGELVIVKNDFIFNYFMLYCSKIMNVKTWFFLCSFIYVWPCYVFSKKYCGSYWYYVFFIFVSSLMFWPFATNGIRNGLATSVFILGLFFYDKKILAYSLMGLAFGIHSSLIIPIAAFIVSGIYRDPKVYLYIWLIAIPLSLIGGGFWENFFLSLGFGGDTRPQQYLAESDKYKDAFAYTGFRWDFLFYSSFAVFAGWYFIFKKKITDKFYIHLWGTYIIANAFWILVIRANFSNRFAYLSWFLMAPVIAYPLLRYKMFPNQYRVVGVVIALYYLFTYFMFLRG
ncbi:hypothetical protein CBW16_03620 [Flavobacteriaceae bacterium JJC]|nr:hypothetical protein CBW16_03620 [Flavobacteriaceae bacterium JJC]